MKEVLTTVCGGSSRGVRPIGEITQRVVGIKFDNYRSQEGENGNSNVIIVPRISEGSIRWTLTGDER